MDILLDPKNKSTQEFLIYRKILDGRQGSKVQNRPNLTPVTPQITFWLVIWIPLIRFGQNLAWTYNLTLQTSLCKNFSFKAKFKIAARGQTSKIDQIWPHKSYFGSALGYRSSDLDKIRHGNTTWPFKQVCARISGLSQNPRRPPGFKGSTLTPQTPQITYRLGIWLSFIRIGQNLAWRYLLNPQSSLRKNLSVSAKSKMAAGGQRSKIDQIWPHKSHFGSAFGYRSSDLDKI